MSGEHVCKILRRRISALICDLRRRKRCFLKKPACRLAPVSYDFLLDAYSKFSAEDLAYGCVGISETGDYVIRRNPLADMSPYVHERVRQPWRLGGIEVGGSPFDDTCRLVQRGHRRRGRGI